MGANLLAILVCLCVDVRMKNLLKIGRKLHRIFVFYFLHTHTHTHMCFVVFAFMAFDILLLFTFSAFCSFVCVIELDKFRSAHVQHTPVYDCVCVQMFLVSGQSNS